MSDAHAIIEALSQHAYRHPRLKAAWLKGSQARGDADRHSDIDLQLWVEPEHAEAFRQQLSGWLAELYPVVRLHILFGGSMVGSILQTGPNTLTLLHLFIETGESYTVTRGQQHLLWDRTGTVLVQDEQPISAEELRKELDVAVRYFWTLFAELPNIERGEFISAIARLSHLTGQLVMVCGLSRGVPRRIGENRGNILLNRTERQDIESALAVSEINRETLVKAHRQLARLMQVKGRAAAEFLGSEYPESLETAVLTHVDRELGLQGL